MKNWKNMRERRAFLALAPCRAGGTPMEKMIFRGWSFGAPLDRTGEVVFNTGMSGYQEIVSDPSYAGQTVVLTAPEIGNYGVNAADMESRGMFLHGLVVHEINEPSNYRAEQSLGELLTANGIPAIAGVDTRRLTLFLRENGNCRGFMHASDDAVSEDEAIAAAAAWCGLDGQDYAAKVTCSQPFVWNENGKFHVVAVDFGVKYNILRQLAAHDMRITVVPASATAETIMALRPDGVFLSNGPADPGALPYAVAMIRELAGKVPLMGICLGHQLLSLAFGAACRRLKFGHHGCNHPVRRLENGMIEITSQNHNFAVCSENFPDVLAVTHVNLNDGTIEGFAHRSLPVFAVQYHPEAAPGPHDSSYLFGQFKNMMEG